MSTTAFLQPHEPPAWHSFGEDGQTPALICVDHASNRVPQVLGDLGLSEQERARHIAYDIGILSVSKQVSKALDIPGIAHNYSRLALDPNRYPEDPSSIPAVSDTTEVPVNQNLDPQQRRARQETLFWPYQNKLGAMLEALDQRHNTCVPLISIHSFTPRLRSTGDDRPWHFGLMWDTDARLSMAVVEALRPLSPAPVGENQPYGARDPRSFTVDHHAERQGRPYAAIEIRQDLVDTPEGQSQMAGILAQALMAALARGPYRRRAAHEIGAVWTREPIQTA